MTDRQPGKSGDTGEERARVRENLAMLEDLLGRTLHVLSHQALDLYGSALPFNCAQRKGGRAGGVSAECPCLHATISNGAPFDSVRHRSRRHDCLDVHCESRALHDRGRQRHATATVTVRNTRFFAWGSRPDVS